MIDLVDETLSHWRRTPFDWGTEDCMLSIATYVLKATGVDYGAQFRDTYCTELGAYAHIANAGGEVALIDASGLQATDSPARGDILLLGLEKPVSALCTGPGAAMRLERGVIEIHIRFVSLVKAWKVPLCRPSLELSAQFPPVSHQP